MIVFGIAKELELCTNQDCWETIRKLTRIHVHRVN